MVIIVSKDENLPDKYEMEIDMANDQASEIDNLLRDMHISPKYDKSDTNKYLNAYASKYGDVSTDKNVVLHPLYIKLNQLSPLNTLANSPWQLKDHIHDQIDHPINEKTFYRNYVSKSLPCVFRNEISRDDVFLEL